MLDASNFGYTCAYKTNCTICVAGMEYSNLYSYLLQYSFSSTQQYLVLSEISEYTTSTFTYSSTDAKKPCTYEYFTGTAEYFIENLCYFILKDCIFRALLVQCLLVRLMMHIIAQ